MPKSKKIKVILTSERMRQLIGDSFLYDDDSDSDFQDYSDEAYRKKIIGNILDSDDDSDLI
jgi:hypothetical protein